jgi:5-formyltetrahydrofolate cyclo-ligase
MSPAEADKDELRSSMRHWRRHELSEADHERRSRSICRHLLESNLVPAEGRVVLFAPTGSEVDLSPLVEELPDSVLAILPRVEGDRLGLYEIPDREALLESLRSGSAGEGFYFGSHDVLEPDPEHARKVPPAEIDLVVVPGLVFDQAGGRIGYGAGYYDRFLGSIPESTSTVGVCFGQQLVEEEIPQESHDQPVDAVVTEDGFQ